LKEKNEMKCTEEKIGKNEYGSKRRKEDIP